MSVFLHYSHNNRPFSSNGKSEAKEPIQGPLGIASPKKRLYSEILKSFFVLSICCLCIICCIFIFCLHKSKQLSTESGIHAVEDYKKWGISISACSELFFTESDHSAFNEGFRYSVLSGPVGISPQNSQISKKILTTTGYGKDEIVNSFLIDAWTALEISKEGRFSLKDCSWISLELENGSRLVVAKSTSKSHIYIIEMLL